MSSEEAVKIAGQLARRLNMPWSDEHAAATRLWRLWPLARKWRVVSRVPRELAETTILVEEGTNRAYPQRGRNSLSVVPNETRRS